MPGAKGAGHFLFFQSTTLASLANFSAADNKLVGVPAPSFAGAGLRPPGMAALISPNVVYQPFFG